MTTIKATGGLWKPYARICSLIRAKPMTHQSIAQITGQTSQMVVRFLRAMHTMDIVHVPFWAIPVRKGSKPGEVWRLGPGISEPCPLTLKGEESRQSSLRSFNLKPSWIAFAHVMRCLEHGETLKDIALLTGLSQHSLTPAIEYMHKKLRMIHVSDWKRRDGAHGGPPMPVFKLGFADDIPRPDPLPQSVNRKRWRQRQLARRQGLGYSVFTAHFVPVA